MNIKDPEPNGKIDCRASFAIFGKITEQEKI
jgi:hypothetical protein